MDITKFWDWYIGLFSDSDNKVIIAALAATVTRLTFVLTFLFRPLYNFIRSKFAKIKVDARISHQIVTSILGNGAGAPLLTCTIINHDNKAVFIQNPLIKLSRAIDGNKTFVVPKQEGAFPMKLEPEQQVTFHYNTVDLYTQLLRGVLPSDKVSFIVTTTTGKKYYSNKFTRQHTTGQIKVTNELNKEQ